MKDELNEVEQVFNKDIIEDIKKLDQKKKEI